MLLTASREGQSDGMATHVKLLPCFGSSKRVKTELIEEPVLARGPLRKNAHFIKRTGDKVVCNRAGQPICQELQINLDSPGSRIKYTCTGLGCVLPLTVMVCVPGWVDYFDLGESLHQMTKCLLDEDSVPKGGITRTQDDTPKIIGLPLNDDTMMVSQSLFPGHLDSTSVSVGSTVDNPVTLSDAPTETSAQDPHSEQNLGAEDEAKILGHYCDALDEMVQSITDLEDSYFQVL